MVPTQPRTYDSHPVDGGSGSSRPTNARSFGRRRVNRSATSCLLCHSPGRRPHIVASLTAASIDWKAGTAKARSKKKPYTVHLPEPLLSRLRELANERPTGPLLLTPHGRPWNRDNMADNMRRICARAKVSEVTPYVMRHSFIDDALALNLNVAIVGALVNHSDLNMIARHYGKTARRANVLKPAAESVARVLAAQVVGGTDSTSHEESTNGDGSES